MYNKWKFLRINSKIATLVIYSIGFTIASVALSSINQDSYDNSSILVVWGTLGVLIVLLVKFAGQQKEHIPVEIFRMLMVRTYYFLIVMAIQLWVYPIKDTIDLTNYFARYTLIDEGVYYEGDEDHSGKYSYNFKYYVPIETKLIGLELHEGRIVECNGCAYHSDVPSGFALEDEDGYKEDINIGNCTSKEVAVYLGYENINRHENEINYLLLPFKYLWYILLKEGIYTFIFIIIIITYSKRYPDKIFLLTNNS